MKKYRGVDLPMKFDVLIVEDNKMIREGLINGIDWNSIGFKVVGECCNGIHGLRKYNMLKPDVIITDIRMPQMDGIEFLEKVRETDDNVKVLMLSGYRDFDYARKAIQLNIYEYVLKEEIYDTFQEVLKKLHAELEEEKNSKNDESKLQVIEGKYRIKEILKGEAETIKSYKSIKQVFVLIIWVPDEKFDYKYTLTKELLDSLKIACVIINGNWCAYVIHFDKREFTCQKQQYNVCKDHAEKILSSIDVKKSIAGIGDIQADMSGSYTSYLQAVKAVDYARFQKSEGVFLYNEIQYDMEKGAGELKEHDLMNLVLTNRKEKLKSSIENTFQQGINSKEACFEKYQLLGIEILMNIKEVFADIISKTELEDEMMREIKNFAYISSLIDIKELLIKLVHKYYNVIDSRLENSDEAIKTAKAIVDNYYNMNINMNNLCRKLYMSPSNLSKKFKKYTGYNFSDYMKMKRIEAAKNLIKNSRKKIYEISHEVGYSDEKHFFKIFKMQTGLTPLQYKKIMLNNTNLSLK